MSATLQIHAFNPDELNEQDLSCFFSSTIGSKYCLLPTAVCSKCDKEAEGFGLFAETKEADSFVCDACGNTELGWLPAADPCGEDDVFCSHRTRVYAVDTFVVGDVSWLKAALTEDSNRYVPSLVEEIADLFDEGECPVITEDVIKQVEAFGESEGSIYSDVVLNKEIVDWLQGQVGKRAFTVSV